MNRTARRADAGCRAVLARDPLHVGSLKLLARIARHSGRFEESVSHLREVVRLMRASALANHLDVFAISEVGDLQFPSFGIGLRSSSRRNICA